MVVSSSAHLILYYFGLACPVDVCDLLLLPLRELPLSANGHVEGSHRFGAHLHRRERGSTGVEQANATPLLQLGCILGWPRL